MANATDKFDRSTDAYTARKKGRQGLSATTNARIAIAKALRKECGDSFAVNLATDFGGESIATVRNTLRAWAKEQGETVSVKGTTSEDVYLLAFAKAEAAKVS